MTQNQQIGNVNHSLCLEQKWKQETVVMKNLLDQGCGEKPLCKGLGGCQGSWRTSWWYWGWGYGVGYGCDDDDGGDDVGDGDNDNDGDYADVDICDSDINDDSAGMVTVMRWWCW